MPVKCDVRCKQCCQPLEEWEAGLCEGCGITYDRACEILGYTTPKSLEAKAKLAEQKLRHLSLNSPIRYAVACNVLINAAK